MKYKLAGVIWNDDGTLSSEEKVKESLSKLEEIERLLEKYEFKDIQELDSFLMTKIPMIYENEKWRKAKPYEL